MLTVFGKKHTLCDRVSRRSFLRIGSLAMGGLALPQLLRAEAETENQNARRHKSVIMIYLSGGPSHQDMFDLKMDAPVEIRGDFKPIKTTVPGIEICQHLPRLAGMMDKLAIIRSIHGCVDQHASDMCLSGYGIGAKG